MIKNSIMLFILIVIILFGTKGVDSQIRPIPPPIRPPIAPPITPPISPPTLTPPITPPISPPTLTSPITPPITPPLTPAPSGNGNPPPSSLPQSYVIAVCLSDYDVTADCLNRTPSQASEKLATMILKQYFKGVEARLFRVVMPSSAPSVEQIQLLRKIEAKAIAIVEAKMIEDVRSLKAFWWETEAEKQQKQDVIMEDGKKARQEADRGSNWSHNWSDDRPSHDFHTGDAFRQLKSISISGWRGQ